MQTTDKGSYEPLNVASKGLKAAGVRIYGMGIGKHVDQVELVAMASDPEFVYQAENFDALDLISESVRQDFCKGIKHEYYSSCDRNLMNLFTFH